MKSVVFCSSQRFSKDLKKFIADLRRVASNKKQHLVILEPNFGEEEEKFSKHSQEAALAAS